MVGQFDSDFAVCTGTQVRYVQGEPDPSLISTSYVERQNLTMRMGMRRFTRLTNAFSKKVENLAHAVSLHFMHYNFARVHKSLSNPYPTTPSMAAGVADHVWTLTEIAGPRARVRARHVKHRRDDDHWGARVRSRLAP